MAVRNATLAAVSVLAMVLLSVSAAYPRIAPLGPAVQVHTGPTGDSAGPQVVALPDGGFVVVWEGPGGEFFGPTTARHFDAAGQALGPEFVLRGVAGVPPIAVLDRELVTSFISDEAILVLKAFTPDGGETAMEPIQAITSTNTDGGVVMAGTPRSEFILVWSDGHQVFGQRYDSHLQALEAAFSVVDEGNERSLAVASGPDGGFVVSWWDESFSQIWGHRVDGQNAPIGEPFLVADGVGGVGPPALCGDESGGFVIAWPSVERATEFRRYNALGEPTTADLSAALDGLPSVACLADRTLIVAGAPYLGAFEGISAVVRAFDSENRPLGQVVKTHVGDFSSSPSVAALPQGGFVVVWSQCAGFSDMCDIFAQRFTLAAGSDCSGDCNGDGMVTIDELVRDVNLALGNFYPDARCLGTETCPAVDTDLDCNVSVTEIVAAVNRALEGCA